MSHILSTRRSFDAIAVLVWLVCSICFASLEAIAFWGIETAVGLPLPSNILVDRPIKALVAGGVLAPAIETCMLIWMVWIAREARGFRQLTAATIGTIFGYLHFHFGLHAPGSVGAGIWFAFTAYITMHRLDYAPNSVAWWEQFVLHSANNISVFAIMYFIGSTSA